MKPTLRYAALIRYGRDDRQVIKILFPFNFNDLDHIRSLPDRKYHSDGKYWIAELCVQTVESLKEWKFKLDPKLLTFLEKTRLHISQVDEIEVPGLRGTLYPFQKKGVAFVEAKQGRALIADEMGLGKTIQTLAWLQLHPELRPVVIVVPASLKLNWEREIMNWMTDWGRIEILHGTKPGIFTKDKLNKASIIIINYDILPNKYKKIKNPLTGKIKLIEIKGTGWVDYLLDIDPKVLITDECHYYKNDNTNRTRGIKKLGKSIDHVIALSGTPIVNRPIEIYNAIRLIDQTIMPSRWKFAEQYCGLVHDGYGWDFSGATNTQELHEKLTNTIMIRRKKVDVLPDLPEKTRSFIPMELENEEEYCKAERDFIAFVRKEKGREAAERASNAQALAEIEGLKQLAVRGKLKHAVDWIRDFLEVDEKLVVFATHKFVIDTLMLAFVNKAVKVDGSVTGVNRQKAVDDFQKDLNVRLFVGNIKAAGIGITLTAASNVAFLELPWTPGEVTQAEDRVHRIGQRNSVNIHYLLASNTIEERVARLIDKKRKVLDAVLDGVETEEESLLTELMNEYK